MNAAFRRSSTAGPHDRTCIGRKIRAAETGETTMTRFLRTKLFATLAASALSLAALGGPAAAGGSLSVSYVPTDPQHAQAVQVGLGLYALVNDLEDGSISQEGMNNIAGIAQHGFGNTGIIEQHGNGHDATLEQTGNGNSYGIFQFGNGANDHVVQNGNDGAGVTVGFGW
jgi:major curlin subunit